MGNNIFFDEKVQRFLNKVLRVIQLSLFIVCHTYVLSPHTDVCEVYLALFWGGGGGGGGGVLAPIDGAFGAAKND